MADLRAQDIFIIAVSLVIVVCVRAAYAYRVEIGMIAASLWRRYIAIDDWRAAMDRLADQQQSVRDYEEGYEPRPVARPAPAHMSSQASSPARPIATVPSTATTDPVPPVPVKNDLTYDEAVRRAAAIKVGGKWWMSGKKLYSVVGGNHARFLEIVSEVRGDVAAEDVPPAPAAADPPRILRVRDSGVDRFIPLDPELEYQPPNGI